MAKRKWRELSPAMRCSIMTLAAVQIGLIAAAHADISRRPADQIRGPKRLWRVATLLNFAGPIAYFAWGRVPSPAR